MEVLEGHAISAIGLHRQAERTGVRSGFDRSGSVHSPRRQRSTLESPIEGWRRSYGYVIPVRSFGTTVLVQVDTERSIAGYGVGLADPLPTGPRNGIIGDGAIAFRVMN